MPSVGAGTAWSGTSLCKNPIPVAIARETADRLMHVTYNSYDVHVMSSPRHTRSTSALVPIGNVEPTSGIRLSCAIVRKSIVCYSAICTKRRHWYRLNCAIGKLGSERRCLKKSACQYDTSMTCPETPSPAHTETGDGESYRLALTSA